MTWHPAPPAKIANHIEVPTCLKAGSNLASYLRRLSSGTTSLPYCTGSNVWWGWRLHSTTAEYGHDMLVEALLHL